MQVAFWYLENKKFYIKFVILEFGREIRSNNNNNFLNEKDYHILFDKFLCAFVGLTILNNLKTALNHPLFSFHCVLKNAMECAEDSSTGNAITVHTRSYCSVCFGSPGSLNQRCSWVNRQFNNQCLFQCSM